MSGRWLAVWACLVGCAGAFPGTEEPTPKADDDEEPLEPRAEADAPVVGADASAGSGGEASREDGSAPEIPKPAPPAGWPALSDDPCDHASTRTVDVVSASQLTQALGSATPGTRIRLAPGRYRGPFRVDRPGRADARVVLCGSSEAVLEAGTSDDVLHVRASHWVFSGFSVTGGERGVITDGVEGVLVSALEVHDVGQEAIHLRSSSSRNLVRACRIWETGKTSPEFGEGVYVGSAQSVWAKYGGSASTPDRSDDNLVIGNTFGPNVRAEPIDIKEGTTGGRVEGNTFDGRGISGAGYADSWVDVKGNRWTLVGNQGKGSPKDGFQVHVVRDGWGRDNVFSGNVIELDGAGYGVWIEKAAVGNRVTCDNRMVGRATGLANVACQ